jgi:hypothetical protein
MVPPLSAVVKVRVALVALAGEDGTPLMAPGVEGAVKSTVHEAEVPMALTLPTESVWRTETVFEPAVRELRMYEPVVPETLEHEPHVPGVRRHSTVPPDSPSVKPIVAVRTLVGAEGTPVKDPGVVGAVRSIVQLVEVATALTLPAASVWR